MIPLLELDFKDHIWEGEDLFSLDLNNQSKTMEKVAEALTPTSENRSPEDKESIVGVRVPEDFYRINGHEVSKEEWLDYR